MQKRCLNIGIRNGEFKFEFEFEFEFEIRTAGCGEGLVSRINSSLLIGRHPSPSN